MSLPCCNMSLPCFKDQKVQPMSETTDIQLSNKQGLKNDAAGKKNDNVFISCTAGKLQMFRMLGITFIPIFVLIAINAVFVRDATSAKQSMEGVKQIVQASIEDFGKLLHHLQLERGTTVLCVSSWNAQIYERLQDQYAATNEAIFNVTTWNLGGTTVRSSKTRPAYFDTKYTFQKHLQLYRDGINTNSTNLQEVMEYYTAAIDVVIYFFTDFEVDTSNQILSTLIAYELLVLTKEQNGIKLALGSNFYASGGFDNHTMYLWFMKENSYGYAFLETSIFYTDTVETYYNELLDSEAGLISDLQAMEQEISLNDVANHESSLEKSETWFNGMLRYINILNTLKLMVADDLMADLDSAIAYRRSEAVISICGFLAVLIISPVIIQAIFYQTRKMQQIGDTLQIKTKELEEAGIRADNLLHQMLPPIVAKELMMDGASVAEYFDEATVCFSKVVNFTSICSQSSPMQVVVMLNTLYQSLDELITKFDAYKVETTGDAYIVTSGIPKRNGDQHAMEMASMALVIQYSLHKLSIPHMLNKPYDLRLGIHSGPCAAGVVGKTMPRYCLFGDTVNTAKTMESTGQANKIHISETTYAVLKRHTEFKTRFVVMPRGSITVKGRGKMKTFWLDSLSPLE